MNITKRELVLLVIIVCLAIGWFAAVTGQYATVNKITKNYNLLVQECNEIIGVQDKKDFCVTLPNGVETCNQNDLNLFQSFG